MSTTKLSQKDYLKKYLSSDDKLKKKKKKSKDKPAKSTVKIIDDDDYAYNAQDNEIDESDLYALNEEAPQVVGVIDERAPDVLMKQEYIQSGKWKQLGSESKEKSDKQKKHKRRSLSRDSSPPRRQKPSKSENVDESPPRRKRRSSDESPVRRRAESRRSRTPERDSYKKRRDSDASPPRRKRRDSDSSPKRRDSDASPPRRARRDSDASPPRRTRRDSDNSPPRRTGKPSESSRKRQNSDESPPRRNRKSPENIRKRRNSSDNSPPRRSRISPKKERRDSSDNSPPRRSRKKSNTPPRHKGSRWSTVEVKREPESPPRSSRMTKTLDGKASGLQDAKTLKKENDAFKERQEKLFREMRPELSGRDAELVIRDRRGRNKEFEQEVENERKKTEAEEARKKVYDRWGKGVKQVEDLEKRFQEHMHEASKPLARSADDGDLQDHLRNQERLDDPMLQYMRKKKQDENKKKGVLEKPKYLGQFSDNRFGIRPGYRWDGVDRSNGYEKKYFSVINSKKSLEEEAYRYSTEDM